jgi:AmiR/NasT family two-component response regulator
MPQETRNARERLRVVLADEEPGPMAEARGQIEAAGHEVVGAETSAADVARVVADADADVAVVALHRDAEHALELVERLNETGRCAVIVLLDVIDSGFIAAAVERGLDAYALDGDVETLESAIALGRGSFERTRTVTAQLRGAEAAAHRRALIERATGVLMERHDLEAEAAEAALRREARRTRTPIVSLAEGILRSRRLLPGPSAPEALDE